MTELCLEVPVWGLWTTAGVLYALVGVLMGRMLFRWMSTERPQEKSENLFISCVCMLGWPLLVATTIMMTGVGFLCLLIQYGNNKNKE